MLLSIDPGKVKTGIAVLDENSEPVFLKILLRDNFKKILLDIIEKYDIDQIVIGNGTTYKNYLCYFKNIEIPYSVIDERNSTIEAKDLYFYYNPLGCLFYLIPKGLLFPFVPIDDYAALVIGKRYLRSQKKIKKC